MVDRLSSLDTSFLHWEDRTTPMHVGGLAVFAPPRDGLRYERLVDLIEQRIALVPRYRQKVRAVPGRLANPVWVDDPNFDITFHVRRSALPKPGSQAQLLEFSARILSRPLDRSRPLWEVYLIEGLAEGRVAVVSKTHQALVDGVGAVDIGQLMLDVSPMPRIEPDRLWMPAPEPRDSDLVLGALADVARRPAAVLDGARLAVQDVRHTARRAASVAGGAALMTVAALRRAPAGPLNVQVGEQRRLALARTALADYKTVRQEHGGTVNDVVLATIAGALRGWLLFRGRSVNATSTVRVMVPMSVRAAGSDERRTDRLAAELVDLPIGEPNPVLRLSQISYLMQERGRHGQWLPADLLVALADVTPPTLHAVGSRLAGTLTSRLVNLVVTNVPGPQFPLYAGGARMVETYPFLPLTAGHAVAIGLTSYDGSVYYGLTGDRDAMPDLGVLASLIRESLTELVALSDGTGRPRRTALTALPGLSGRRAGGRTSRTTGPRGRFPSSRGPKGSKGSR